MMKKATILAILLFVGVLGFSQGNLQFNQIILYDFPASAVQNFTVPAGKVWKIESGGSYNGSNTGITVRNAAAQSVVVLSTSASATNSCYPFWLPSGYVGSFFNAASTGRAALTIIEFNVVP